MSKPIIQLRVLEQYCRLQDFPNYAISNYGKVLNIVTGKQMSLCKNNKDYYYVDLYHDGERLKKLINRLVGLYFINNPNNLPQVDHIDRNSLNNHVWNLRWVTHQQNMMNKSHTSSINGYATSSNFRGVSQRRRRWRAFVYVNQRQISIGSFKTEKEAAIAYNNYVTANNLPNILNVIS
ncbi:MAG: HNH endonuclease [Ignavibacteriaceae bacterium]|nr:HNH endonuclease [Ignavibacteriaceae bacterium]